MSIEMLPCSTTLKIEYENTSKKISSRHIDVKCFSSFSDGYLRAFCHSRGNIRTFKFSGLRGCIDTLTGEVINVQNVHQYLIDIYNSDPRRELDFFLREHKSIIDIFTYVAMADGRIVKPERTEILQWIFETSFLSTVFFNYAEDIVKKWSVPENEYEYFYALRLCGQLFPHLKKEIFEMSKTIAMADNNLHDEEIKTISLMGKVFNL